MNLKSFKKNIKYHLFNTYFHNNSFTIFEIKVNNVVFDSLFLPQKKMTIEAFSKQIFAKSKIFDLRKIRFPNKVKFITLLNDFIYYLLMLKEKNYMHVVYLIKMYFITVTKSLSFFINIFIRNKTFFIFYSLFSFFIKNKALLQLIKNLNFPFITGCSDSAKT